MDCGTENGSIIEKTNVIKYYKLYESVTVLGHQRP